MICLICHGKNNHLPKYDCGHCFHASCLKKWAEYTNLSSGGEKMVTKISCPYCNEKINLFKETRIDEKFHYFYNNLSWSLRIYNILKYDYDEYSAIAEHEKGICEKCGNKDNIIIMKIIRSNKHIWLCNNCQNQEDKKKRDKPSYDKSKYEIMNQIMNFCWENRLLIRKNVKFRIMVQNKSREFIENISKEFSQGINISNTDKIQLKKLNIISQKLLKYNF